MPNKNKKPPKDAPLYKKFKTPLICLSVLILIIAFIVIFRGWIRQTVIPKTVGVFYASDTSSTLSSQNKVLAYPLKSLGFGSVPIKTTCSIEIAQSIHEEVDCEALMDSYVVLPHNLQNEEQQAKNIQNKLSTSGWQGGSNEVTLTSLVTGMAKGVDWSADANYEKIIGGNEDCVLDIMIAYSNPQPPAIRGMFSCDRTIDFLGKPSLQFYSSSKGHQ